MKQKVATQLSPRIIAARKNGSLGGKARAAKHSKAKLRRISSKAGRRCLELYGKDFYSNIRKNKKTEGRYRTPVK